MRYLNYKNHIILIFIFSLIIFSCNSKNDEMEVSDDDIVSLQIGIEGVTDAPISNIHASSIKVSNGHISEKESLIIGDGFVMESSACEPQSTNFKNNIGSYVSNKSAVTKLDIGIKLRLLIYEITPSGQEIFKSDIGAAVQGNFYKLSLVKNTKYKFYVYSYNNYDVYPPTPADLDNPVIETSTQYQMLYASGNINVLEVPLHVSILFRHLTSRISVAVDAQSFFANSIVALQANLNDMTLTTHDVDLKTGNLIGGVKSSVISNMPINFGLLDKNPAKMVSTNRIYTSTPFTPTSNVSYRINSLIVSKNGANQSLINASTGSSVLSVNGFSGPLSTVFRAYTYIYPARNIGGDLWASGNLYYDAGLSEDMRYRFAEPLTIQQNENCNYYFSWNSLLPRSESSSPAGDPCSLVYPAGKWKTPSESEFLNLIDSSTPTNEGTGAVKFTNLSDARPLIFNQAGWIFGLGCTVTNSSDGQYWTISEASLGVLGRMFEVGNEVGGPRVAFDSEAKGIGASIRCIRVN